jgi:asparagine synthase (glutamine-hydrolysing)
LPPHAWDRLLNVLPRRLRPPQAGERMHKIADILPQDSIDTVYRALISQWQDPARGVVDGVEPGGILFDEGLATRHPDAIARMQVLDTLSYLPDDILTKVDRASMAVSLEARVPLLDHRVVEFAWTLPRRLHTRNGQGKWLLRQILHKYVPRELVDRPKQGFAVPVGAWLRGPLRDWAESLLDENRLREDGFFQPGAIRRLWDEHQSGRRNRQYQLWGPLMFQAWRDHTAGAP